MLTKLGQLFLIFIRNMLIGAGSSSPYLIPNPREEELLVSIEIELPLSTIEKIKKLSKGLRVSESLLIRNIIDGTIKFIETEADKSD